MSMMKTPSKPRPGRTSRRSPQQAVDELGAILAGQLDGHDRLLSHIREKREAIRRADLDAIERLCRQENELVQRLGDLEKRRLMLVGELTKRWRPDAAQPLTMREIAECCDEPAGADLRAVADRLRSAIETVRRESAVVREAAEALSRHLAGVVQTVHAAVNRAVVYGRRGTMQSNVAAQHAVDVRS